MFELFVLGVVGVVGEVGKWQVLMDGEDLCISLINKWL